MIARLWESIAIPPPSPPLNQNPPKPQSHMPNTLSLLDKPIKFKAPMLDASILESCNNPNLGKQVHAHTYKTGFFGQEFVDTKLLLMFGKLGNALIDMYGKCGSLDDAKKVLETMSEKDRVMECCCYRLCYQWEVIGGFSQNCYDEEAIEMLFRMVGEGIEPNAQTLASVLPACARLQKLSLGKEFHGYITRHRFMCNAIVVNGLTGSALTACADTASLRFGREVHAQAIVRGLQSNTFVGGALVELCCKCQDLMAAQNAFNEVSKRDTSTWNALISGYARCNQIKNIQHLFRKMKEDGFEPNVYTWNGITAGHVENDLHDKAIQLLSEKLTSNMRPDIYTIGIILPACSRSATIERGKQIHAHSIRCGYDADVYIGAALVDMYAKCGSIQHALLAYNRISDPNLVSHNAMHGHGEDGRIALFRRMIANGFRPDHDVVGIRTEMISMYFLHMTSLIREQKTSMLLWIN
ncbi:hypothetical protein CRYUN_Cryun07bG0120300 [Craigia yunnanensis]